MGFVAFLNLVIIIIRLVKIMCLGKYVYIYIYTHIYIINFGGVRYFAIYILELCEDMDPTLNILGS